jgi:hypothetical protein
MTHIAGGSRRGIPKAWILPLLAVVLILGAVYLDLVSRSIAVDFLAWWPVWVVLVILAFLARRRRWGRVRVSGLIPILWVTALGLLVTGHVLGWEAMPSTSIRLAGPAAGSASTAALSAQIDGVLDVGSGQSGFLYAIDPVRRGGDIGPPTAVEQIQGTNISVALEPFEDPGLYTFAGWLLHLDEGPTWNISLGGDLDADLRRLRLSGLQLNGEGDVSLGSVPESVVVSVSGDFELTVPPGVPVRVVGEAVVPAGWVEGSDGMESPTPGNGWVVSVGEGSSLTVTEG